MNKVNRVLWGLVFIVLGVIVALNALDIISFNIFFHGWWTLFIIVPCFIGLFDESNKSKLGNIIGMIVGVLLLLLCQGLIRLDIIVKLFIPVVLIIIGIYLILGSVFKSDVSKKIKDIKVKDKSEGICATFSEQFITKSADDTVESVNLDAVFGSVVYDLSDAKIKNETVIKASAIFGGIDIIVPKDVEVKVKSTPIFGGVSNKNKTKGAKKVVYVDALALFGSVDIK